ncbi:YdcF family protein [Georgenia deserti]|uniref:YdcF family protein n=1 Tax=Georgenia deserti TaxID=2093781 RepID=A0ABW4L8F6_9MICO
MSPGPVPDVTAGPGSVLTTAAVTGLWAVWLWWSVRRDARRLRNGFLLVAVVYSALGLVAQLVDLVPGGSEVVSWVSLAVVLLLGLGLLALPVFLLANGLAMVRRERRSPANLLSLVAGLAMIAAPVMTLFLVAEDRPWSAALAVATMLVAMWAGYLFLGFVAQTLLYRWLVRRVRASAVIVLGARVVGGRVPPLLASRLRTGLAVAQRLGTDALPAVLVPSGGQGPDEDRPEGEVMADWLRDQGVPDERILVDDRARTTRENLRNSVELLRSRGIAGPYLMATNNYHAPRAALEALDLGLDVHAVGAPTAGYYVPSAYLREFVAVISRRPLIQVPAAAAVALVSWVIFQAAS